MSVEYRKWIVRSDLIQEPEKYFLFGDNLQKIGYGGQARDMRGEPNAIGIPTKRTPYHNEQAFFTDDDFDNVKYYIDREFAKIPKNAKVVVPEAGLGTGLAELPERAPKIYEYILEKIKNLL
jgi:hypothetical protein